MEENQTISSILMLPWLAHGHVSPYLELARKLTARNFNIYLCSTPINLSSIRSKISPKFGKSIQLIELNLPTLPNLPPQYHTTNGLPPHLMVTLKEAFEMASPNFCKILRTLMPDLLIYDLLQPWAPEAASYYNIPAVEFITCSATMTSCMLHFFRTPGIQFPYSSTIFFRDYESAIANKLLERDEDANRVAQCIERSSKILLIKSFKEIEGKYNDYVSCLSGKKVVPVGPLVQDPVHDNEDLTIMEWLNTKGKYSTVFVSFGSEYFLSKGDLEGVAHGLELSSVNFVWVVRFPKGENIIVEEALPKGFLKRVGERGKIVNGWAPQAKILNHSSIGGFVSHCGWNSVLEGMRFGVPIIAVPMHLDQPVNARLLQEVGAGMEVVRGSTGKIHGENMAEIINQVVKGPRGEPVRKKARDLREKLELKGDEEIDEVVKELVQLCLTEDKNNGLH
ncbi:beta-D-glucosyl crocetin beta-1,6-glucosyltransferase-like [Coffea eugenioides]|uniref:beta-D-glucosyl crocetin beta-1,6-glucosyltransferase-like n=1 Tax=Coffea eugenioides TaxID=49369 RepID=UPI000F6108D9|nr:beta-D-glucosyl crocetin beta-1,6-glucosyltransferase-like [Coffea eugenioides]